MSPLWSDEALARAAWDKAVDRGLVDETSAPVRKIHPAVPGALAAGTDNPYPATADGRGRE